MAELKEKHHPVNVDEMLTIVGEYGKFQKIVNLMFCIMMLPSFYQVLITYFTADDPDWRCVRNSSTCIFNGTFPSTDNRRCHMQRKEWEFTKPKDYSVVTYFDVNCGSQWLIELVTSIMFIGWIIGAFALGVICDKVGRKLVLMVSINVVLFVGFICIFVPNMQLYIACRFFIGFFLPGTVVQMFIIATEIVGAKQRPLAGLLIFASGVLSLTVLGAKAYFIREWKVLHIVCTVPYVFLILFFKFFPESIRYLRVKGKMDDVMVCFNRIAYWNKKTIPKNYTITEIPSSMPGAKPTPMDLFRTWRFAFKTSIQTFANFATGIVYYGLYLAAGDLGGSIHRDFIIISGCELPINFLSIYMCERFGRKKTTIYPILYAFVACIAVAFTPKIGYYKIIRVVLGITGKCMVGSNMNTLSTWTSELYPTAVRGAALGLCQAALRLGASIAPWIDKELVKVHKSASFLFMAGISLLSFLLMTFLPETQGTDIEGEEDDNIVPKLEHNNASTVDLTTYIQTETAFVNDAYTNECLEITD